jgi:hypothetical protein
MQQIVTAMAAEGMVLAQDVLTPEGRVLCGKGTELSTGLIERLKRMEIHSVTVEGHPLDVAGEKSLQDELHDLDARFSRVEKIAPLMYLKKKIREKLITSRS